MIRAVAEHRQSKIKHWDRFWEISGRIEDVYSNVGRVTEQITRFVSPKGKLVLEVGAGSGRDGINLARLGASVVSLDYSMKSLGLVGSQAGGNDSLSPCCADAFELPFESGTFDIVFHQGLLEHFRNPDDLVAENARVLKRGGYLLIDVPQRYHYYTLIKHLLIPLGLWFAGWETEYSVTELENLVEKHSFSIVSSYGEWFNPPIWYMMLRKGLLRLGVRLPMYPRLFSAVRRLFGGLRSRLLRTRWALRTTVVVGTIAVKK